MLILFYFLIITNYERKKSEILMILNQFEFQIIKNEPIKLFIIFIFILFLLNIFYFYTEKNNNRSGYHIII